MTRAGGADAGAGTGARCPVCGRAGVREYRPFCSRRCADLDLGRWLRGGYAIPTEESPEQGGAGSDGGEDTTGKR